MLLSEGFLVEAKRRIQVDGILTEAALRRCVSDLYFAMFHCVCETLASPIHSHPENVAVREAWARIYRLPDHGTVAKQCDDGRIREFPDDIQNFASQLKGLKSKREYADYDASEKWVTSDVRTTIQTVETAMMAFKAADEQLRLSFAVLVAIKKRGH